MPLTPLQMSIWVSQQSRPFKLFASSKVTLSLTTFTQQSAFAFPSMTIPSQPASFNITPKRPPKLLRVNHSIG